MEDRRSKYARNNPIKNKDAKIDVQFDITELELMCRYITSSNTSICRGNIINLRNVFLVMNMKAYGNDQERLYMIDFILKGIDARLNYNLSSKDMILTHITGGFGSSGSPMPINVFNELNNNEVDWVNSSISEILKYSFIYKDIDDGISLLTKFKSTDYRNRGSIVKDIEKWCANLNNKFRKARAEKAEDLAFSLQEDAYQEVMRETYRHLAAPSNKLKFGTQALNLLTNGGVESQRVYTLLGLPGEGKSSTLLDMAIEIKRYNKEYVCKDPTKRPCVVLLIMENSIKETVQRIFNMCVGGSMLDYTEDEAVEILRSKGNLRINENDPIDLIIKFRPNLSEDTSYMYTLCEDLEDDGYETICFIQDYMKRIRSVEGTFNGDLRMQLGAVVNEMKVFAILKDIPVITATQLNRTATSTVDEARIKNKADLVRLIGRANVGESNLIIENTDWMALLAPEYDSNGVKHLGMQVCKTRYFIPDEYWVAFMPYVNGTIKLVEDFYSPTPVHKITLKEAPTMNGSVAQGAITEIKEFTEFNDVKLPQDIQSNIFINANAVVAMSLVGRQYKREMCHIVR